MADNRASLRARRLGAALLLFGASTAAPAAPAVVTDIAPVQSLVAMVSGALPPVLVQPGASPHDAALRPSDARRLEDAEVVVWIGPSLGPSLDRPIRTLAAGARIVVLGAGTDGSEGQAGRDTGAHGDHGGEDHEAGHAHGADAHAWLDPLRAVDWVYRIAEALAAADPGNAGLYAENAEASAERLERLAEDVAARLPSPAPVYLVTHDALGPFEDRFGLSPLGTIADSDALPPSAARLAEVSRLARETPPDCILVDRGATPGLVAAVAGDDVPRIDIDILGTGLEPGPDLYPRLIEGLADAFLACGSPE